MVTHDQSEALSISDRVVVMEAGRITQVDTPYRAYERPETSFVSQFIGKANMLRGTIVARDGEAIRIDLGHDLAETGSTSQLPERERAIGVGDAVTVCIRPEKLKLGAAGSGRLPGRVTSRFFLGSQWLYRLDSRAGEMLVCCQNHGDEPLEEGAQVGIDWNTESIRFIQQEAARG
jgi:putative spermidine/putrescine transport system ATP-binding protein